MVIFSSVVNQTLISSTAAELAEGFVMWTYFSLASTNLVFFLSFHSLLHLLFFLFLFWECFACFLFVLFYLSYLSLQAPASSPLVDTAAIWTLEFSQPNGSNLQRETVIASTFTRLFQNLSKGTEYRARVAGFNSKGMGVFSGYQTTETLVDSKFFYASFSPVL